MFNCFVNHVCSHCMQSLEDNRVETIGDVRISDMLSNIFFIPWREFIIQSNEGRKTDAGKTFVSTVSDVETSLIENEIISIPICCRCESAFVDLYKAYTNYDQLANSKSLIRHARDFVHRKVQIDQTKPIDLKCEDNIPFDDFQFNDEKADSNVEEEIESKHDPLQFREFNTDLPRTRSQQRNLVIKLEKITEETVTCYQSASKIPSRQKKKIKISSQTRKKGDCERKVCKCKYCDKTFGSRKPLIAHEKTHQQYRLLKAEKAQGGPFTCDICGKMYANLNILNKHRKRHGRTSPVNCEICGKTFPNSEYCKFHIRRVHAPQEEREKLKSACTICGKRVFRMKVHIAAKHGKTKEKLDCKKAQVGPFPCDICGKVYKTLPLLNKHRKRHDPNCYVKCEQCGKTFHANYDYKMHIKRVHDPEEEREQMKRACTICGKLVFQMSAHMLSIHGKEKEKFNCNQCEKVFLTLEKLELHIKAHESTTSFKCLICEREFPIQEYLSEHHEKYHTVEKSHACHLCPKRFHSRRDLEFHMIITHTTGKPYVCEQCGTAFKHIKYLNKHLKKHADEGMGPEAFKCNECGKTFKNRTGLTVHKSRFHRTDLVTSKKIHECSICGKRLYDDLNLRKHQALHYKKSAM